MDTRYIGYALLLCGVVFWLSVANAGNTTRDQDIWIEGLGKVAAGYPGRDDAGELKLDVAKTQVQVGLIYYYRLHGHWPGSWQAVKDDLLYQAPLMAYGGEQINPDDSSGGFLGDIYFDSYSTANSTRGEAHLRQMLMIDSTASLDLIHIRPPLTYADWFADIEAKDGNGYYSEIISDTKRMQFFALLGVIKQGIYSYGVVYGHPPYSWQDYLDSGLAPIDENSINPLTGGPIYADGRPNGIVYEYHEDRNAFFLRHVESDGSMPTTLFSY